MSEHDCNRPHRDRRQALVMLLGGGLVGAAMGSPRHASAGATQMAALPVADGDFTRIAIAEAAKADFPFGAVTCRDGDVLAIWPQSRQNHQRSDGARRNGGDPPLRRGAARRCAQRHDALHVGAEPCPMCMSAILWCGIGRVVFAASIEELATKLGQNRSC